MGDSYNSENYKKQGGDHWVIGPNGQLENQGRQLVKTIEFDDDTLQNLDNVGQARFNPDDKTFDVRLSNSVIANIPTEQLLPRCVNKTGADIPDGTPVYISGAQGARPIITIADASTYATSSKTIGITTEAIANNAEGFVCRSGYVRYIDTSAWANGTCLYLSTTAGEFTAIAPSTANQEIKVICAMVIHQHATEGILCVKIMLDRDWFGDIDNNNYTYWDSNGVRVSKGSGRVIEDLQFSISGGRVPAANAPTFETFTTNTKEYSFDVNDFLYLDANEPPHAWDFSSTDEATWHVHVTNKTTNSSGASQYAKFTIYVGYVAINGVWTESTFVGECEIEDGTLAMTKKICVLTGTFDMSNVDLGGQIKPTVKRIAATSGTEYADNVFITQVGLHGYKDQDGSRTVSSK